MLLGFDQEGVTKNFQEIVSECDQHQRLKMHLQTT